MNASFLFLPLTLVPLSSQAALVWTGAGDGSSLYQEANWFDNNGAVPATNQINPNTDISAATGGLIEISSGTGTPGNYNGNFQVGTGNSLTVGGGKLLASPSAATIVGGGVSSTLLVTGGGRVLTGGVSEFGTIEINGGTIDLVGSAGVNMAAGASTLTISNGGSLIVQFLTGGAAVTVDGTSSIEFLGTGDPINSQIDPLTIDFSPGAQITMATAAEIDQHINDGEIFVGGTLVTASNKADFFIGSGTTLTAIPEPSSLMLLSLLSLGLGIRRRS